MVAKCLVDPYGQWTSPSDGERPSKSVASSHESRAGNARDRKGRRERNGRNGRQKEEKATRCTLCCTCKHQQQPLQQVQPQQQQQLQQHWQQHLNAYDSNDSESEYILVKFEGELLQPYRLPSSLATGLHRCRICCSWTSLFCQWAWRRQIMS